MMSQIAIDQKTVIQSGKQLASLVRTKIDSDALVLLFGSSVKTRRMTEAILISPSCQKHLEAML